MPSPTISSQFRDVDKAGQSDHLVKYLEYIDSIPEIRGIKERSYQYLGLMKGDSVLDAGCGPGFDAIRIAAVIGRHGQVTGIDLSEKMIATARKNAEKSGFPVTFRTGNVTNLGFPDESFNAIRIERTLQVLDTPQQVLDELVRVLKPGGRIVATEPDWDTFVTDPGSRDTARTFFRFCNNQFPDGSTGRKLFRYFRDLNLRDITIHPEPLILHDLRLVWQMMNMEQFLTLAQEQNAIEPDDASAWRQDLETADKEGRFTFAGMIFSVSARK
jgi:ubiquinone/menaquinone biosynthesis C-methylase UbiE